MTDPIANLKLSRLGKADVRQFRDRQQELYSDATVVKRLNLLAAILNCAAREWDMPLPLNPASSTSVPRPAGADKKRNRRLIVPGPAVLRAAASKGEDPPMTEEAVLYTVLGTSGNEWDVWLTRWAIAQATRQGEALGLRWRDIDLDRKTFRVLGRVSKGTKNDQHREEIGPESRPLMPGAIFILNAIKPAGGAKPDTHVFPVGDHMAFRVRWGRTIARAAAGLPDLHREMGYLNDLTYHDLRHEATSRLAKIYTNPMDLKRVTGHRDLKSLDRYYQPDLTELAERAE
jgi:integrase